MTEVWNHRAIRDKTGFIGIHEVHYTKSGRIVAWTESNVRVGEGSIGDLEITLNRMLACLERPLLEVYTYRGKKKLREVKP